MNGERTLRMRDGVAIAGNGLAAAVERPEA